MKDLEGAEAERDQDFGVEPCVGVFEEGMELVVQANLPAEHAEHQGCGQVAVGGGERIHGFAAEQVVGVGLAALDGHEYRESGFAGWREGGHGT
jgi:hypothetical protein